MQTAHQLFLFELSMAHAMETQILEVLRQQEKLAGRPDLKNSFATHLKQTERQIERLDQCFESLGEEPQRAISETVNGMMADLKTVQQQDPAPDILDVVAVSMTKKVEHLEIVTYESLVRLARMMGHNKALKQLEQNLKEEQGTLAKFQRFSEKMKPEDMGMEEMQGEEGNVTSIGRSGSQRKSVGRSGGRSGGARKSKSGGKKSGGRSRRAA